jgi:adenosylcobinamide kinase/adenosylcobinamide-phosphate guanylyltransferase
MSKLVVMIGGARSGKSTLALEWARRRGGAVVFVATAVAFDDDMTQRIAAHRAERPPEWTTIEAPRDLLAALTHVPAASTLVLDCLTTWTGTLVFDGLTDPQIRGRAGAVAELLAQRTGSSAVVTNEVGAGVHPETELGRRYRDLLGAVNQEFVRRADRSLLLVAGRAVELRDPFELL